MLAVLDTRSTTQLRRPMAGWRRRGSDDSWAAAAAGGGHVNLPHTPGFKP